LANEDCAKQPPGEGTAKAYSFKNEETSENKVLEGSEAKLSLWLYEEKPAGFAGICLLSKQETDSTKWCCVEIRPQGA
jgi:hypothetical protein